ncbi:MAG TPA: lipopolysaccharide assembly protein LapA domain-containing protein [Sphingomicrobium sp.]|nr:lipopolysaccharide assembly protein LapA domain-containing protein [Sphingomicrobium sp.]
MQFLKTLFWVLLAVFIALFASRNWSDVTLNLWGDIQVDIKIPVLLAVMFLAGFLPVFLVHRARLWTMQRRIQAQERQQSAAPGPAAVPAHADDHPVT